MGGTLPGSKQPASRQHPVHPPLPHPPPQGGREIIRRDRLLTNQPSPNHTPWWKSGVIYQIYVRSFADTNGDGIGDLAGITSRLDYLNDGTPDSLGVDAIWLTPFYSSPDVDFGYDVADYRTVDPKHGTLDDFDTLVAEAHNRGIRVILDFVPNHTSDQHPWFLESRSGRDNPKRDWYIWRDGVKDGPPNNWRAVPGGRAWERDPLTGQYYYHAFFACQPDLNFRNADVRDAVLDDMRFWLDRGADGFRLDLINYLFEDEQLRNDPFSLRGWSMGKFLRHEHTRDLPETHETLAAFRRMIDEYHDRMMVGEIVSYPWEASPAADYTNARELNLAFNMELLAVARFRAGAFRAVVDKFERRCPDDGWPAYVLSNHDIPRHLGRLGGYAIYNARPHAVPRSKVAAAMLLTLRGTPFLYYGEELGMTNRWWPRSQVKDPIGKLVWPIYQGRDACRTPMLWEPGPGGGFTTGTPWLPVDPEADRLNVKTASADPDSLLTFYKRLLWLRRTVPALQTGAYEPIDTPGGEVFAYRRTGGDRSILVALNFTPRPTSLAGTGGGRVLLSSRGERPDPAGVVSLAPYEVLILEE